MATCQIFATLALFLSGCRHVDWNPENAKAEADEDIRTGRIRIYFVGGYVPTAPGIPVVMAGRYPHRYAGGPGCTESTTAQREYARRYNEQVAACLANANPVPKRAQF